MPPACSEVVTLSDAEMSCVHWPGRVESVISALKPENVTVRGSARRIDSRSSSMNAGHGVQPCSPIPALAHMPVEPTQADVVPVSTTEPTTACWAPCTSTRSIPAGVTTTRVRPSLTSFRTGQASSIHGELPASIVEVAACQCTSGSSLVAMCTPHQSAAMALTSLLGSMSTCSC